MCEPSQSLAIKIPDDHSFLLYVILVVHNQLIHIQPSINVYSLLFPCEKSNGTAIWRILIELSFLGPRIRACVDC